MSGDSRDGCNPGNEQVILAIANKSDVMNSLPAARRNGGVFGERSACADAAGNK